MRILPIFIPHFGCPFKCIYCNQIAITKSVGIDFDEIKKRIINFNNTFLNDEKEIAFYGGTFTGLDINIQKKLFNITKTFGRHIPIRISTRPDFINDEILKFLYQNNVATIELGIQSFSDKVLKLTKRGYSSRTAITSCKKVKENGFKLSIQLMPGLPGFDNSTLVKTLKITRSISPAFIRIYPTIVLKNTELEEMYQNGIYTPLSLTETIKITSKIIKFFENTTTKIIKIGLHSDIKDIVAGPYHQSFGELVKIEMFSEKLLHQFKKNKTLHISNRDISLFKGFQNRLLTKIKKELSISNIPIKIDNNLNKGEFYFSNENPDKIW